MTEPRRRLTHTDVRAIEGKADVESLGVLHHLRRELLKELAPLKALHGPFGLFEDKRKQMIEAMKVKVRQERPVGAPKLSNDAVDALAHAHQDYVSFLDTAEDARINYIRKANDLSEIEERIRSRDIEIQFATAELRLHPRG